MSRPVPLGLLGWGSVAAPSGSLLPDDLDPFYQPLLGRRLRKVGRFIKLAVAGAALAVQRSGLEHLPAHRTGVFLGTGLGNLPELVGFTETVLGGSAAPSPTQFANSVGNSGAFYVAQAYGLSGPALAVSQDEVSFECALLSAATLLRAGDLDLALVGGVDVYWPDEAAHRIRMGFGPGVDEPLGEGSGWVVLERLSEGTPVELGEVAVAHPDPGREPADLDISLSLRETPASVCLGTRLRLRAGDVEARLPPGASLVRSDCGIFPTQSAVHLCVLLDGARPGWGSLHTVTETREGLRGRVTVRRRGEAGAG